MTSKDAILMTNPVKIATDFINQSERNIFLTGRAGTGKTTFLRALKQNTYKNTIVVAPTGIAAINAGGVTIHSFFQLPFGNYVPKPHAFSEAPDFKMTDPISLIKQLQIRDKKRQIIRQLELLIIDEVSMLRADTIDAIDLVLKHVRHRHNEAFGGVQVLFIGDMLQLPPVVKENEWRILKDYYDSMFFFDSLVLKKKPPIYIELDKIFRQHDPVFISMLNNIRQGKINAEEMEILNQHYMPFHKTTHADRTITITTHNKKADDINQNFLDSLISKEFHFYADVEDNFPEHQFPIDERLTLKMGAQVMFIKNDPSGQGLFFNGKIGIISKLSDKTIEVTTEDSDDPIVVEKYTWENIRYELNEQTQEITEVVVGKFTHFPLKLAWAITVHKSQGLTFEKAVLDISESFASGQIYVALSRLTGLKGLILKSKINFDSLKIDQKVSDYSNQKMEEKQLLPILESERFNYVVKLILDKFIMLKLFQEVKLHHERFMENENALFKDECLDFSKLIFKETEELLDVSEKFDKQIRNYAQNRTVQSFDRIMERCLAAESYFSKKLSNVSNLMIERIDETATNEELVDYTEEIINLEKMTFDILQGISSCAAICRNIMFGSEVNIAELCKSEFHVNRSKKLNSIRISALYEIEKIKNKKSKPRKKKTKEPKEPKIPSHQISYELYLSGKSIEEIALERGLVHTTIFGHLTLYIKAGKIPATDFLSQDKIDEILNVCRNADYKTATAVREILGDKYSYNEIRIALAAFEQTSE
ncbi:MAG: helix-turn-helix domain-containing protein [Bacteroidales bacterium]|nr:helix-turn-helix domain-containing protein [Bacteroidales bacterium]